MNNVKQVIAVRKDIKMKTSKIAAYVAHASMQFLVNGNESEYPNIMHVVLSNDEAEWIQGCAMKVVVGVESEQALQDLILKASCLDIEAHVARDDQSALVCVAFGPADIAAVDIVTGHLQLF